MSGHIIKSSHRVAHPLHKSPLLDANILPLPDNKGFFFYAIHVEGRNTPAREQLLGIIAQHAQEFQAIAADSTNVPRKFEQSLQTLNQDISQSIQSNGQVSISDLNAVVGVQHKQQIFLSGVGNIIALFMHRTVQQRYAIYELDQQFHDAEPTWEKPFLTVLDGEMHPGDVLYIATRINPREMDISDIQDTLVTLPPSGALKRIEQHLYTDSTYAGVCFKVQNQTSRENPKKQNPLTSVERLNKTKEDTANLLGEQAPDIQKTVTQYIQPLLKKLSSPGEDGPKAIAKQMLRAMIKWNVTLMVSCVTFMKSVIGKLRRKQEVEKVAKQNEKTALLERLQSNYQAIPSSVKYLSIGFLATIILVAGTFSMTNSSKQKAQERENLEVILRKVEDNKNAAEATLIYNDTTQANKLLQEAAALLETIPKSKEFTERVDSLRKEIERITLLARGVTFPNVTTLATIDSGAFVNAVIIDDVLYGITEANNILMYNELSQSFERENVINGSVGNPIHATTENNGFLAVDENNQLGRADLQEQVFNPIVSGTNKLQSIEEIVSYGENLYALTATNNQIIRMRAQGAVYDGGTNWIISSDAPLSQARGMTIDGDIYVLTNTTIRKFRSGIEQTFNLSQPDPNLQNPTRIWTSSESSYLYVLDMDPGRVIVFNKDGEFITQYMDEVFNNAIQFIVREEKKTIVIITKDSFYEFPAEHLLR